MWGLKYITLVIVMAFVKCPSEITTVPEVSESSLTPEMMKEWIPTLATEKTNSCKSNLSYVPDTTLARVEVLRRIRMNFHFINTEARDHNYSGEAGVKYAQDLVFYANDKLVNNFKMNLPVGNETAVYYPQYRYDLEEDGVFFHADNELAYYVNEGKRNNYKRDVINKYQVGEDSVLNVFYMIHHPDSVASKTYSASAAGIALGKSIKLGTKYDPDDPPWKYASLLNHEVGHVMGLSHSWGINDGCDDTPKHPNCWAPSSSGPCSEGVSNNMMDYNSNQHAISPCQIGKVRKNMARMGSRQRDLLKKDWCELNEWWNVEVDHDSHFTGAKDLHGNLLVKAGVTLRISCRISMPPESEIRVEPGGKLILDGAWLHNDCGKEWKGIIIVKEGDLEGEVLKFGEVKIENVTDLPPGA